VRALSAAATEPVEIEPLCVDDPVKNVRVKNNLNRGWFSALQVAILEHLATIGPARPRGDGMYYVGHWPTTGAIAVAVGRPKDNTSMVSVSRSLDRLCRAGLVVAAWTEVALAGRGRRYGLTDAGRSLAGAILEEPATEPEPSAERESERTEMVADAGFSVAATKKRGRPRAFGWMDGMPEAKIARAIATSGQSRRAAQHTLYALEAAAAIRDEAGRRDPRHAWFDGPKMRLGVMVELGRCAVALGYDVARAVADELARDAALAPGLTTRDAERWLRRQRLALMRKRTEPPTETEQGGG
jgi:hypothetical protein